MTTTLQVSTGNPSIEVTYTRLTPKGEVTKNKVFTANTKASCWDAVDRWETRMLRDERFGGIVGTRTSW